ncbi:MAG: hypothetical protein HY901_00445 [Deltaproteobacteria bacterium]|nr:hypothetical protein [Deltaproteobacteria bacterium]
MRPSAAFLAACLTACSAPSCEPFAGPEAEILRILERHGETGATLQVAGAGSLQLSRLKFDRLLVKPESGGLTAVGTVDAEGRLALAASGCPPPAAAMPTPPLPCTIAVSYLGLERIPFDRTPSGALGPKGSLLPALAEAAALMVARNAALRSGDAAALEPLTAAAWTDTRLGRAEALEAARERIAKGGAAQPRSWTVRVEREQVEVLEEAEAPATRAVERARFVLVREGGRLRFAAGLL